MLDNSWRVIYSALNTFCGILFFMSSTVLTYLEEHRALRTHCIMYPRTVSRWGASSAVYPHPTYLPRAWSAVLWMYILKNEQGIESRTGSKREITISQMMSMCPASHCQINLYVIIVKWSIHKSFPVGVEPHCSCASGLRSPSPTPFPVVDRTHHLSVRKRELKLVVSVSLYLTNICFTLVCKHWLRKSTCEYVHNSGHWKWYVQKALRLN